MSEEIETASAEDPMPVVEASKEETNEIHLQHIEEMNKRRMSFDELVRDMKEKQDTVQKKIKLTIETQHHFQAEASSRREFPRQDIRRVRTDLAEVNEVLYDKIYSLEGENQGLKDELDGTKKALQDLLDASIDQVNATEELIHRHIVLADKLERKKDDIEEMAYEFDRQYERNKILQQENNRLHEGNQSLHLENDRKYEQNKNLQQGNEKLENELTARTEMINELLKTSTEQTQEAVELFKENMVLKRDFDDLLQSSMDQVSVTENLINEFEVISSLPTSPEPEETPLEDEISDLSNLEIGSDFGVRGTNVLNTLALDDYAQIISITNEYLPGEEEVQEPNSVKELVLNADKNLVHITTHGTDDKPNGLADSDSDLNSTAINLRDICSKVECNGVPRVIAHHRIAGSELTVLVLTTSDKPIATRIRISKGVNKMPPRNSISWLEYLQYECCWDFLIAHLLLGSLQYMLYLQGLNPLVSFLQWIIIAVLG